MQLIVVCAVALVAGLAFYPTLTTRLRMRDYWQRSCTGRAWVERFPTARSDDIRRFLHLFVDAFAFPRPRALYFAPTDQIMTIYRTLYPLKDMPDALEVETLARRLKTAYGVDLASIWREDITLGDVFAQVSAAV